MTQGLDAAIQTLMAKSDRFLRVRSWDIIRGFFTLSMDYDYNNIVKLLSKIKYNIKFNSYTCNFPIKIITWYFLFSIII